jgi:hypothetical protein
MIKKITALLLLLSVNAHALDLFKAEYKVYKNGKEIGTSSIELSQETPFYKIIDKSNGTHGLASFLGFKRTEETIFLDSDGQFLPQSYKMNQKVAFNKRSSEFKIDTEKHTAIGKYKGNEWQSKVPTVFSTPNLVSLNLFHDICAGKTENLNYPVLKKGKIQTYQFKITSKKDGIIEVDKVHSKPTRITKTWLDSKQQCIPVKTYHVEKDEDPLESKLIQLTMGN